MAKKLTDILWTITVEKSRVDVTLESEHIAILIENKIKTASMSDSTQLVRYYQDYASRYPNRQIIVVLVTPTGRGKVFVDTLQNNKIFLSRKGDIVSRTTWHDLATYEPSQDDTATPFASAAITAVSGAAAFHAMVKSTRQSEGKACAELVEEAFAQIKKKTSVPLQYWGPDNTLSTDHVYYQIYSTKHPVTLWSGLLIPQSEIEKDILELDSEPLCLIKIKLNESRIRGRIKKNKLDKSYLLQFRAWWQRFASGCLAMDKDRHAWKWDEPQKWLVKEFRIPVADDIVSILRDNTLDIICLAEESLQQTNLSLGE